eukprot:4678715-Pyramimonas_sp.AAC.1
MKVAFFRLGRSWYQKGVPHRWERCIFLCHVLNTGLSGVEAFVLTASQLRTLELAVAGLARRAMRGEATWEDEDGQIRSMTTEEVMRWWRLVPIASELRVRRLRWLQACVRRPGAHKQMIAAVFGSVSYEEEGMFLP